VISPARLAARIIAPVVREVIAQCREDPAPRHGEISCTGSQVEMGDDGVHVRYGFGVAKAGTGIPGEPS